MQQGRQSNRDILTLEQAKTRIGDVLAGIRVPDLPYPVGKPESGAISDWTPLLMACWTEQRDEPVSHLDLGMAQRVLDAAGRRAARGRGVIAVLHDLERASRWAERLLVLSGGRLIADGSPAQILTGELVRRVWDLDATVVAEDAGGIRIRPR